jgi:HTH-type transcriptional regulator/antitoxin HigA
MADEKYRTPGQLLRGLLDERGWDQRVLSVVIGVEATSIHRLLADKKPVDAAMALALGEVFGIEPERLLDLQKSYDLAKARIVARPDQGRAKRAALYGKLPISEMIHRGWLRACSISDFTHVESELAKFFETTTVDEIDTTPYAAKKTDATSPATPAQQAWIYRVKHIAKEMVIDPYSRDRALKAVDKLKSLLLVAEESRHVPKILAEAGIRFVIVESLKSAKIDGVCLWLDDTSPVIGMSLRFDRIDNFWFVLRHEIEHVLHRHGRDVPRLDVELENQQSPGAVSAEERLANNAAAEFCVPSNSIDQFIARKAPIFAERDLLAFARTVKVHPGLVVGQLQRRTNRYDLFPRHLVKIRSIIAPNSIVDGWGDVALTQS